MEELSAISRQLSAYLTPCLLTGRSIRSQTVVD
jgi:hypothetical protein